MLSGRSPSGHLVIEQRVSGGIVASACLSQGNPVFTVSFSLLSLQDSFTRPLSNLFAPHRKGGLVIAHVGSM